MNFVLSRYVFVPFVPRDNGNTTIKACANTTPQTTATVNYTSKESFHLISHDSPSPMPEDTHDSLTDSWLSTGNGLWRTTSLDCHEDTPPSLTTSLFTSLTTSHFSRAPTDFTTGNTYESDSWTILSATPYTCTSGGTSHIGEIEAPESQEDNGNNEDKDTNEDEHFVLIHAHSKPAWTGLSPPKRPDTRHTRAPDSGAIASLRDIERAHGDSSGVMPVPMERFIAARETGWGFHGEECAQAGQ